MNSSSILQHLTHIHLSNEIHIVVGKTICLGSFLFYLLIILLIIILFIYYVELIIIHINSLDLDTLFFFNIQHIDA